MASRVKPKRERGRRAPTSRGKKRTFLKNGCVRLGFAAYALANILPEARTTPMNSMNSTAYSSSEQNEQKRIIFVIVREAHTNKTNTYLRKVFVVVRLVRLSIEKKENPISGN